MSRSKKLILPLDPNQRWLTVTEASRYTRLSPTSIRSFIHAGRLKAVPDGIAHGYRLDRVDLDAFMIRQKRIIAPYRRGTHPWVARRHAANRRAQHG